jgi:hypothetical protein
MARSGGLHDVIAWGDLVMMRRQLPTPADLAEG